MKKVLSKTKAKEKIEIFFNNIKTKSQKDIKKIKKTAMSYNLPLKEKRKLFCKKCLSPFLGNEKTRIKNKTKSIECKNCNCVSRWKIS